MRKHLLFAAFVFCSVVLGAQTAERPVFCGFDYFIQMKKQHEPAYYEAYNDLFRQSKGTLSGNRDGVLIVPVVFHIVHNTSAQNLADSVIHSQMQVLNEDYRRWNADAINTRDVFLPVAADIEIQFQLAAIDPQGNPTTGITRTQTTRAGFSMNFFSQTNTLDEVKSVSTGGANAWDPSKYLNIWICRIEPSFLGQVFGMAYPPDELSNWPAGSHAPTNNVDGVIVHYTTVGRNNPEAGADNTNENDLGRTLTHEVGHYFGLRHIWGDELFGNLCAEDDGIEDTPRSGGADQYACNHNANTCGAGEAGDLPDMIENYMDYTKEHCYNLFTEGQKEHMRYVLQEKRSGLLTGEVLSIKNKERQILDLSLWPNPAKQMINVRTDINNRATYSVINLLGETIVTGNLQRTSIDISQLSAGMYILSVTSGSLSGTQRFVVE